MPIQNSTYQNQQDTGCNDCKEDETNLTQRSINRERVKICDLLYDTRGTVAQQETKFSGESELFENKKCMFRYTEENYQRYRNLDITAGTELLQTNESVKVNVDKLKKWNTDLNTLLKNLNKSIKDAKAKFGELRDASCKLDSSMDEKCNIAQRAALTGKLPENCTGTPPERPKECRDENDSESFLEELICLPKGLALDIDTIFQSSADVVGIQVFSNIDTLEPLQTVLSDQSKEFAKQINDTMKLREGDLKKLQEDLVKSVQEITKAAMEQNSSRSDFEGYYDAVEFLCCPTCKCVNLYPNADHNKDCKNECKPRLGECGDIICRICGEVQETFCCPVDKTKDPGCKDLR